MTDYLFKFASEAIAEQFGITNGFAAPDENGEPQPRFASHEHALCIIGEHFVSQPDIDSEQQPAIGDGQYWVLFRDLVGIPIPEGADQFIFWASNQSIIDDAGDEIFFPRPEFNPDVPSVFWA
jgi:hypothetical protein